MRSLCSPSFVSALCSTRKFFHADKEIESEEKMTLLVMSVKSSKLFLLPAQPSACRAATTSTASARNPGSASKLFRASSLGRSLISGTREVM